MKYIFLVWIPVLAFSLAACQSGKPEQSTQAAADSAQSAASSTVVLVSPSEATLIGLQTDTISQRPLGGGLKVNGVLDVPPEQLISINAPLGGVVERTTLLQGQHVHTGDVLAVLRNPAFIQLQQDFLQTQGQLTYAKADLDRQTELVKEEVAPVKNLQRAQAEYAGLKAQLEGIRARLTLAGLPAGKTPFATTATLRAPKDAYVKTVNVTVGQSVTPIDALFQLVDPTHLHVELTVFERDAMRLKPGMPIRFTLPNDTVRERKAFVYLISRDVDLERRTVRVHGHLQDEDAPGLLPGMFVRAIVDTSSRTSPALPSAAVVTYEGASYVFQQLPDSAGKQRFRLQPVQAGESDGSHTPVRFPGKPSTAHPRFATKGAYELLGKLKNRSEEE